MRRGSFGIEDQKKIGGGKQAARKQKIQRGRRPWSATLFDDPTGRKKRLLAGGSRVHREAYSDIEKKKLIELRWEGSGCRRGTRKKRTTTEDR